MLLLPVLQTDRSPRVRGGYISYTKVVNDRRRACELSESLLSISDPSEGMEHLWSQAGATGGNRSQIGHPQERLKQADRQPVATHGNRSRAHGKEGVDGSSPSEGFNPCLKLGGRDLLLERSLVPSWYALPTGALQRRPTLELLGVAFHTAASA